MSCHEIGRGLNTVTKKVIELYEQGRIGKEEAICIIHACRKGVHWCDGNEYEAVNALIEAGYCGLCFEKVDELLNAYDSNPEYPHLREAFKLFEKEAANFFLCKNCVRKVCEEYTAN